METRQCPSCGAAGMVHETRSLTYEYKGDQSCIQGMSGWFCDECGESKLDKGLNQVYFDAIQAFTKEVDQKEGAWLVDTVRRLKLSNTEAVAISGGGKNALSKYRKGEASPVPAVYILMSLLDKHPNLVPEVLSMPRVVHGIKAQKAAAKRGSLRAQQKQHAHA